MPLRPASPGQISRPNPLSGPAESAWNQNRPSDIPGLHNVSPDYTDQQIRDYFDRYYQRVRDRLDSESVRVQDSISAVVTRSIPQLQVYVKRGGWLDMRNDFLQVPIEPEVPYDPPEYPHDTFEYENGIIEALRAKDSVETMLERGKRNSPLELESEDSTYQIRVRVDGKNRYKQGRLIQPPCVVLRKWARAEMKRKHSRTGNSKARLEQIRRTYAWENCA